MKAIGRNKRSYLGLAAVALCGACSAPSWDRLEGANFSAHVEKGMDPAMIKRVASWTESDLTAVGRILQLDLPTRELHVYCGMPRGEGGHLRTSGGEVGRYSATEDGPGRIELVADTHPDELRGTLRHEIAHHYMQDLGYAEWLNEGLAEYVAYELAVRPSDEDVHHLLHAGLVLAGWDGGFKVKTMNGNLHHVVPELWLPLLPEVLRLDYEGYASLVLKRRGQQLDPDFHSISHLLVRVMLELAGSGAPWRYNKLVQEGTDPWQAYLEITKLENDAEVYEALAHGLDAALMQAPGSERIASHFVNGRCLFDKIPDDLRFAEDRPARVELFPGGPMLATFKR